jgi:formate-dependent nitrite reductase membrane component NrfD
MSDKKRCISVLALVALAYFVSFPEDAQAITTPISTFLNLTSAISPWFYGVVAVGIIATAMVKTWTRKRGRESFK